MKKILLVLFTVLLLCGCHSNKEHENEDSVVQYAAEPIPTATPTPTAIPTPSPTPTPPIDIDKNGNFTMYGQIFNVNDSYIDLRQIQVNDGGELVESMIPYMPNLKTLDMDRSGVDDERMAEIRDAHPEIEVIWRVFFGQYYSVRTNVVKILASNPGQGGNLLPQNCQGLKYCTKVKYLDIGHNEDLKDISFVEYMPNLEVLIAAMIHFTDLTPLANCKKLEFLEIQTNCITDLSPLSELHELKHLNIGHNSKLEDISPLYGLAQLERLWIDIYTPIPEEQIEKMQELAPDCVIKTGIVDPHDGWRWKEEGGRTERYDLLIKQLGYDSLDYSFSLRDPYYYMPAGAIEHEK